MGRTSLGRATKRPGLHSRFEQATEGAHRAAAGVKPGGSRRHRSGSLASASAFGETDTVTARPAAPRVAASADKPITRPVTAPETSAQGCKSSANGHTANLAASEIQSLGWSVAGRFHRSYTGLALSRRGHITVYRVVDPKFDRAVRRIAAKYRMCVEFIDAPISRWRMLELTREIRRREPRLKAAGAPLSTIAREVEGRVVVGVGGDVNAARKILKDLDHVEVIHETVRTM